MLIRKEGWDWDVPPPASRAGDAAETSSILGSGEVESYWICFPMGED